jgi:hypothetical protein
MLGPLRTGSTSTSYDPTGNRIITPSHDLHVVWNPPGQSFLKSVGNIIDRHEGNMAQG